MTTFFTIWAGQALSLVGSSLVQFALVWWLTHTSGSATVLAMANMMEVLPRIFVSPVAGALVDRWNRRLVMMVADGGIALAVVALAILYALGAVQVWHIYLLMFVRAVGGAFHWPAMQASTTLMVSERHLGRVAGMNQTLQGLVTIVAPPLGALLYELLPVQGILAIDVVTAALAIGPLFFISIPQPRRQEAATGKPSVLADLRQGLRFVRGWPGLVIILVIGALANMMTSPAFALVPLLVSQRLGGGALRLGFIQSAFGVGVLVGGLTLSVWGGFRRRIITVILASVLGGLGFVAVGLVPPHAILLAEGIAFCIGFLNPIFSGSLMAMFQALVPPDMQGRVFTLMLSATAVTTPLGLAIAGPVGDALGVQAWFLIAGVVTAVMGMSQLFIPAVMHLEDRASGRAATGDAG
jgi:DHA3 family macrolide efflux protein-like MFS transporter